MSDNPENTPGSPDRPEQPRVGYRNPPKATQFPKGQPGNRKGRPKRRESWAELFRKELNKRIPVEENGRRVWISKRQARMRRIAQGTLKLDPNALKTFLRIANPTDPDSSGEGIKFYIIGSGDKPTYPKKRSKKRRGSAAPG